MKHLVALAILLLMGLSVSLVIKPIQFFAEDTCQEGK